MTITWQSAEMKRARFLADAYDAGFKAGALDRDLGVKSEYTFNARVDGGYPGAYGTGYYDGILKLRQKNPWRIAA